MNMWNFLSIFHIQTVCNPAIRDNSTFTDHFYLSRLLHTTVRHTAEHYIRSHKTFRLQEVIYRIERLWNCS